MGKGSCCPKLCANREFTVYRLVREFKSKLITAIVLHQFCSPCLVLPVGEGQVGGGGGEGWRGVNKVPGLTLIVHNLKMNKEKFTNPAFF